LLENLLHVAGLQLLEFDAAGDLFQACCKRTLGARPFDAQQKIV